MKRYSRLTQLLPWLICGLGAIFYSYEYFLRITPSVMTDDLMKFYHIQDGALGSLSAFYYYIYTPMQLVVGVLMDRYGPRRLLTIATLCCVAGSVLFATTHELFIAELGRLLIGFGSAFAFVGVLKLGTIWLPRKYFALFAGLATSLGMIGAIIGDNLMTAMKNVLGWQETVLISAAFGVLLALAIGLFVRDKKVFDNTPKVTSNLVKFSDALPGLLKIALTPQFWVVGAIGALLYVPASVFAELWGIPYLETHFHFSDTDAASAISLVFLGWVFGGPLYGLFSEKIHSRNIPLIVASLASTLAFIVLIVPTSLPEWSVFTLLFLIGFVASGQSLVFAIGKELGPAKLAGSSIAFVNMAVMLGGLLLQPILGYSLQYLNNDYHAVLMIIPIGMLLSAVLAKFALKETACRNQEASQLTCSIKPQKQQISST